MVNPPPYEAAIVEDEPAENFYYSVEISNTRDQGCKFCINHRHINGTLITQTKYNLSEITTAGFDDFCVRQMGGGSSMIRLINNILSYFGPMKLINGNCDVMTYRVGSSNISEGTLNLIFTEGPVRIIKDDPHPLNIITITARYGQPGRADYGYRNLYYE